MDIQRIAAFSDGDSGGNPAGVVIADTLPDVPKMQAIAADVGFSETAFAAADGDGYRVRYFAPESEVPFCGHATIALGAALAMRDGDAVFNLTLNDARITVEGKRDGDVMSAALQSPPTRSEALADDDIKTALDLFGYSKGDLNASIPPALMHGGADHWVFALNSREALSRLQYDFDVGRDLMVGKNIVTIMFAFAESEQRFHTRNPFASGGVYEDSATGAATAAFAGYLRDIGWPHGGVIDIVQGEDMRMRSLLRAEISDEPGASIRVSGTARVME
ncbi:MAG: PhzF family phenazine biosynthesis protein [Pseudomonadota bacterium]